MTGGRARIGLITMALVGLVLMIGCREPTQLLVVIDTDMEPGREISAVEITASGDASFPANHRFLLPDVELPFSFGVTPSRTPDEAVRVVASALDLEGEPLIRRVAETRYIEGRTILLEIPLARACASSSVELACEDQETCIAGECASAFAEPSELPNADPDATPNPLFMGPRIAPDGGPQDGGVSCVQDDPCDSGEPCRPGAMDCAGDLPTCEPGDPLDEGTSCGSGRSCDSEGVCG